MKSKQLIEELYHIIPSINHKFFHELPKLDIPRQQLRLLHTISMHDGEPMKFFSEKMYISKPNLTKLVDQMIDQDMVVRGRSEKDRRIITLSITEQGKAELKKHWDMMKEKTSEIFEVFEDGERDEILDHFKAIKQLMEKIEIKDKKF